MPETKRILSIDGGGIRGIIPVCMLARLESQTGKLAKESFSFAAGTSTGAIIAAGVAAGIPATSMLNLYLSRGDEVFPQHPWNLIKRVVLGHMYSSAKLRSVLLSESGPAANWKLNDSPIDILITAKRVRDGMPWYFVKDSLRNSGRTGKLNLIDCITASSIMPTYHEPWIVPEASPPPGHQPVGRLVDGGVGVAGNPIYQACVEAFLYTEGYVPNETIVVSLGTGRYLSQSDPGWMLPWIKWTLGELLDSAGEQQTEIAQRHFGEASIYRVDPKMPEPIGADSVKQIPRLREIGESFAASMDWLPILAGEDSAFRISETKTLAREYKQPVTVT